MGTAREIGGVFLHRQLRETQESVGKKMQFLGFIIVQGHLLFQASQKLGMFDHRS